MLDETSCTWSWRIRRLVSDFVGEKQEEISDLQNKALGFLFPDSALSIYFPFQFRLLLIQIGWLRSYVPNVHHFWFKRLYNQLGHDCIHIFHVAKNLKLNWLYNICYSWHWFLTPDVHAENYSHFRYISRFFPFDHQTYYSLRFFYIRDWRSYEEAGGTL